MNNQTLKQIISQIKKYELTEEFSNEAEFKSWVEKLNSKQINNFLSLDIELSEIMNIKKIVINSDLLKCEDYNNRVKAIASLKNGDGYWHLYDYLCNPKFLKSQHFYKDIELLSNSKNTRYGFWALMENDFIESPYHDEDLKLISEAKDTKKENPCNDLVWECLATVAGKKESIKSPYHREHMKLIATSGSDCLQSFHTYPEHGMNYLAVNKESLKDPYHLENMKILATNPMASMFLYKIMTTPKFINGKNYRKEVEALVNAKSKVTARALYYYIVNPKNKFTNDREFYNDCDRNIEDASFVYSTDISVKDEPDYLDNLTKINQYDDEYVMYYVSLLMNKYFINSPYKKFDLDLLGLASNRAIFMDLYRLISDKNSLNSPHHKKDVLVMSRTLSNKARELLYEITGNEYSLESENHVYDVEYISKLDIDSISEDIYNEMYHYLCSYDGINDKDHVQKLEKLAQGILVGKEDNMLRYFDSLEEQIKNSSNDEIIKSVSPVIQKQKSRFSCLFKNKRKK